MKILREKPMIIVHLLLAVFAYNASACDQKFEGFGIFLGKNSHFAKSKPGIEAKVLQVVYDFLGIRLFRTSYEEHFSPEPKKYEIRCTEEDGFTCSWIKVHRYISTLSNVKVFASIWSPPHYMKDEFYQLTAEYETAYYHFIKNITELIQQDHTNMSPEQLCRIIRAYDDLLISVCPENSYYWVSKIYYNFGSDEDDPEMNCSGYCDIKATHGYSLNLDFTSDNSFLAYYDLKTTNVRETVNPIWQTEVCSTYHNADQNQMTEALYMAMNILNFLGTTCVQRYYFWYSHTLGYSGESLLWGDDDGNLIFPKKFFVYKLFVNASNTINEPVDVNTCNNIANQFPENVGCLQFGDEDRVLVNQGSDDKQLKENQCMSLCCTTETDDFSCSESSPEVNVLPTRSVCHCTLSIPIEL